MSASLLSGKHCASHRTETLKQTIDAHVAAGHRAPGLAVILLGEDPASVVYVNNKRKACLHAGIRSQAWDLPANTDQNTLLELIDSLNASPEIDGILVQTPLPSHIHTPTILEHILPAKDVDGFHPYNLGKLAQRNPGLRPCTPLGIMNLLEYYEIPVKSKHAVVIGASNIVGRPMGLELLLAGATVTICHKFTDNLQPFVEMADLVILATGVLDIIKTEWLKPHQVIIDAGIHRLENGTLRGDIDYKKALDKVSWITPVPGGVGPMTIVTLLENTWYAYNQR